MDEKRNLTRKYRKTIFQAIMVIGFFAIIISGILFMPKFWEKKESPKPDFSAAEEICELATLHCYYHDVAEFEKKSNGLFNYGYKKMWLEYDGVVTVGIDVSQVKVYEPDENSVVRVYVPDAQIITVDADEESMGKPIVDTGAFTSITTEEKARAFSEAQTTMRANVEADAGILKQAKDNAKELLKQYIINVGEQIGQEYTVEWIENLDSNVKEDEMEGKEQ